MGPVLAARRLLAQVAAVLVGRMMIGPVSLRLHCLDEVAALVIYTRLEVVTLARAERQILLLRARAILLQLHSAGRAIRLPLPAMHGALHPARITFRMHPACVAIRPELAARCLLASRAALFRTLLCFTPGAALDQIRSLLYPRVDTCVRAQASAYTSSKEVGSPLKK